MPSASARKRESGTLPKAASYNGRLPIAADNPLQLQRPESHPELLRRPGNPIVVSGNSITPENGGNKRLTKLLLNVTIQRSLGPVQVVISPENTVEELIRVALEIYVKEKRRPFLTETDHLCYELHYSQFSLESLNPKEKLINLGSRNFFLCQKPTNSVNSSSSCSDHAKNVAKTSFTWTRLMDLLQQF